MIVHPSIIGYRFVYTTGISTWCDHFVQNRQGISGKGLPLMIMINAYERNADPQRWFSRQRHSGIVTLYD